MKDAEDEERLYRAIGEADDELLERLERVLAARQSADAGAPDPQLSAPRAGRTKRRKRWSAVAASLVFAAAILWVVNGIPFDPGREAVYTASGPVVDRPADAAPGGPASGMTAAPRGGETVYDEDVRSAIDANVDPRTEYFVAIDIFANGVPLDAGSDGTKAELKRLRELGLNVGYAEAWTYAGAGERETYRYAAGFLTAEQLARLMPAQPYGYALRFAVNGDGSPVSAEAGIRTDLN